jgi:1-acyl-sn-glycerol-3-phosphate acyltransferase
MSESAHDLGALAKYHEFTREHRANRFVYRLSHAILTPLLIAYLRLTRTGMADIPAEGAVLIVSNHRSFLDPFLIGTLLPAGRPLNFMGKAELFARPRAGWYVSRCGCFPVRRGESDPAALETARRVLEAGGVLVVFPGGHAASVGRARAAEARRVPDGDRDRGDRRAGLRAGSRERAPRQGDRAPRALPGARRRPDPGRAGRADAGVREGADGRGVGGGHAAVARARRIARAGRARAAAVQAAPGESVACAIMAVMAWITPLTEAGAPESSRSLAAAHAATGGRMTNMKWTLAHSPAALEALLQWYPLHDEVAPLLGERRTQLFCLAISVQNDCLICSTFFRRLLADAGDDPDALELNELDELIVEFGRRLAVDPHSVDDALRARLDAHFTPAQIVLLAAFGAIMVATNVVNDALGVPLDGYLEPYRARVA